MIIKPADSRSSSKGCSNGIMNILAEIATDARENEQSHTYKRDGAEGARMAMEAPSSRELMQWEFGARRKPPRRGERRGGQQAGEAVQQ